MQADIEKVEVLRWSFCSRCKRVPGSEDCPECQGAGTTVELVKLSEIPVGVRWRYVEAQQDFLKDQLKTREHIEVKARGLQV